jgi:hypothetical protein
MFFEMGGGHRRQPFGVLAPILTGYVISGTGSCDWAFLVAGALLICGAVTCWTMTRDPISPKEACR